MARVLHVTFQPDQATLPVSGLFILPEQENLANFILIPAIIALVRLMFIRPPFAIPILRQPPCPDGYLIIFHRPGACYFHVSTPCKGKNVIDNGDR